MRLKVVHVTTVHPRDDIRIFIKQCNSLATRYDVSLIVADGIGDDCINGIKIIDVGYVKNRIKRILLQPYKAYKKCIELSADIYQFHDPELLSLGFFLRKKNKLAIYDVHEDVEKDILTKEWIPAFARKVVSFFFSKIEKTIAKRLTGIISATPVINIKFSKINNNSININNYPLQEEFNNINIKKAQKKRQVCYVGGICKIRGIEQALEAAHILNDVSLVLAGRIESPQLKKEIELKSVKNIIYKGHLSRKEVCNLLEESVVGIATLLPTLNYIESQPIKIFEYMAAGIPVIASNFPLWKLIIEDNNCGICVNPNSPQEIAEAISTLVDNPKLSEELGENGRKAVLEKYNWESEKTNLLQFYDKILKNYSVSKPTVNSK